MEQLRIESHDSEKITKWEVLLSYALHKQLLALLSVVWVIHDLEEEILK